MPATDAIAPLATRVMQRLGIASLNSMQQAAVAACSRHSDIILVAPTGSGKTIAYTIALLAHTATDTREVQGVVIVPTRELAQQVERVVRSAAEGVKVACCYGGHSSRDEVASLGGNPGIVIGTPGRLADHLRRGNLTLAHAAVCVIDEYDKCLELGFETEVKQIVKAMQHTRLRMLTSATQPQSLPHFMDMQHATVLQYESTALDDEVTGTLQLYSVAAGSDKLPTLAQLLCHIGGEPVLVFVNRREDVEAVAAYLRRQGIACEAFHGGMEQPLRERALCRFAGGSSNVCVATDLAARGLDIAGVTHVVHYHLPHDVESYTHRNGRTARMHAGGNAYLLLAHHEYMPPFVGDEATTYTMTTPTPAPATPRMAMLHFAAGKREKLSRGDILGFLTRSCGLPGDAVGRIEVKDHYAYASILRSYTHEVLQHARVEKIKGRRIKVSEAL